MTPEDQVVAQEGMQEDAQIAWENLECARLITTTLKSRTGGSEVYDLDLALIHSRLGDLSKHNGSFKAAFVDYGKCLELRESSYGPYHRKVADAHMSLANVLTSLALGEGEDVGADGKRTPISKETKEQYTRDSVKHYLACGKAFAGLAAGYCEVDPRLGEIEDAETAEVDSDDDEAPEPKKMDPASVMKRLQAEVRKLPLFQTTPPKPAAEDGEEAKNQWLQKKDEIEATWTEGVADFMFASEMVDEMVEYVEAAGENVEVLGEVGNRKAELMVDGEVVATDDGTQIGFGGGEAQEGSSSGGAGEDGVVTTFGFGAATDKPTASVNAQPMMVVRKKKKATEQNPDPANDNNKKQKTEP